MNQANASVRTGNGRRNIEALTSLRGIASAIMIMSHVWRIFDLQHLAASNPSLVSLNQFVLFAVQQISARSDLFPFECLRARNVTEEQPGHANRALDHEVLRASFSESILLYGLRSC